MRATAEARAVQQQDDDARGTAGDDGVHDGLGHRRRVALLANGRLGAPVEGEEPEQEDEAPESSQLGKAKEGFKNEGEILEEKGFYSFVCISMSVYNDRGGGRLSITKGGFKNDISIEAKNVFKTSLPKFK